MTQVQLHPSSYLALPRTGAGPGILVVHAWWGLTPFFKALCRRLAGRGFVVLAPDLYHGQTAETVDEAKRLRGRLKQQQAAQELQLATECLHGLDGVTGPAIGVMGFSLGARFALELSVARPKEVGAVVAFYGTSQGNYAPAQAAYLGQQPWGLDSRVSQETAAQVDGETRRLVEEALDSASALLSSHRVVLDQLAERLCEHETVNGSEVTAMLLFQRLSHRYAADRMLAVALFFIVAAQVQAIRVGNPAFLRQAL